MKERHILRELTGIEEDIRTLRRLTTQIPGQRMLSRRAGNMTRGNNIRSSVQESSKVAQLSKTILSELEPVKRRLYSDEGQGKDISPIIDLIREYTEACKPMLRFFHETNTRSFREIILQSSSLLDSLTKHVSTLDRLLQENVSEEGSIPEQTGNAPQYTSNSNDELNIGELNELLGGNDYNPNAPLPSRPAQRLVKRSLGPTPRLGTPRSLPVQTIQQLRQTAAAAASAEAAAAARAHSEAEKDARSATVTATGPRRSLAGLFAPPKGGKTRRSRRVHVKPSRRVHVKPRGRTSKNRRY